MEIGIPGYGLLAKGPIEEGRYVTRLRNVVGGMCDWVGVTL